MAEQWVGWCCTTCKLFMYENPQYCPRCLGDVFEPAVYITNSATPPSDSQQIIKDWFKRATEAFDDA